MADGQEGSHDLSGILDAQFVCHHEEVIQAGVAQVGTAQVGTAQVTGVLGPGTVSPVDEAQRRGLVKPAVLVHPAAPGGPRCRDPHMAD
jgi:hypothetical protein